MEKPRRTEETERSEKIKDHETNKNDGIEWNGQGARPMDSIDLTQPFNEHELEKERDEEEETGKEEEQANIIIEVDSQGKLSPKLERGADVLVDIPVSHFTLLFFPLFPPFIYFPLPSSPLPFFSLFVQ